MSTSRRRSGRILRSTAWAVVVVGLGGCASDRVDRPVSGELRPVTPDGRDLRRFPPAVDSMTARKAPDGRAILEIRFSPGEKLPSRMSIQPHDRPIELNDEGRDDDEKGGDGTFSGRADLDVAELEFLEKVGAAQPAVPDFAGRSITTSRKTEPTDVRRYHAGLRIPIRSLVGSIARVKVEHSLMITDLRVVENPARTSNPCTSPALGKWTFGYLMTEMANTPATKIDPSEFVLRWLTLWETSQHVNGQPVQARPSIRSKLIEHWPKLPDDRLDLTKAPFRLLAIVNRIDLADNLLYGGGSAGEGRFVFCAVDLMDNCAPLPFTVIFEYGIRKRDCSDLKAWARRWQALSALELGSEAYNAALESITEQFVKAGADPSSPNRSALRQLRTNENALNLLWEMREFQISTGGRLSQVTVKQTPDLSFDRTEPLSNWINANRAGIVACRAQVPDALPGSSLSLPFLAGSSLVPQGKFWSDGAAGPAIADREARHRFSLKTCSGCHAGETGTVFTHVSPAPFGTEATLSGFLTGKTVNDPADGSPARTFNDLARRRRRMAELLDSPCLMMMRWEPLRFTH